MTIAFIAAVIVLGHAAYYVTRYYAAQPIRKWQESQTSERKILFGVFARGGGFFTDHPRKLPASKVGESNRGVSENKKSSTQEQAHVEAR